MERVGYLFEVRMSEVYCGKRRSFIAKNVHVHGFFYLVGEPEKEEKIPEKVVNFQKLLNEYKERAETKLAYTIQQLTMLFSLITNMLWHLSISFTRPRVETTTD